ncbi:hypothetical protein ACFO0N_21110 [Halobium salinum]|uniref:DUF35 domain-containing protein n=1 Tax=Halobium salinum TaxID=1364940 RepID=A0ABD5PI80_9EURY|nr:hypothetical protein [Halobium salinum]
MSNRPTAPDSEHGTASVADVARTLRCFACEREYAYLGTDGHPGVCPSCDSRAVSFSGEPRVVSPERELVEKSHLQFSNVLRVVVVDDTDRRFEYLFALTGGIGQDPLTATAKYVRVGDHVIEPTAGGPYAELFPNAVGSVVREITGSPLSLPGDRDSTDTGSGDVGPDGGRDSRR